MEQVVFHNNFSLDETLSRCEERCGERIKTMDADDKIWVNNAKKLGVALIHTMFYLRGEKRIRIKTLNVDPDIDYRFFGKFLDFEKITDIYVELLRDRLDDLRFSPVPRGERLKQTIELLTDYLKEKGFEVAGGNVRNAESSGKMLFFNDAALLRRIIEPKSDKDGEQKGKK